MISALLTHEHTRSFHLPESSSVILQCSNILPVETVYFPARFIPRHFSFTHFFEATVNRAGLLSPFSWCLPSAHGKGAIFYWFCILLLC